MGRGTDTTQHHRTKLLKVGATSTGFFLPIILFASFLNVGPSSCNPPTPPPVSFVVTDNTLGTAADDDSWGGVVSSDGTRVAFTSKADNLLAPFDGALVDVFIHDINTNETNWVGTNAIQFGFSPAITADGGYAVFSAASAQYPGFQVAGLDTTGGDDSIDWIFTNNGLIDPQPSISRDGRYVAFRTDWKGTGVGDWDELDDIYVRDRQTGDLFLIGEEFSTQYGLDAHSPKLASHFNRVVYQLGDEWVRSVNVNFSSPSFPTTFPGIRPSINAWGSRIAYRHVWPGKEGAIFLHESGLHQGVSIDAWGQYVTQGCDYPVISGDGRFVAFQCADPMTSHGGYNQVYVRDLVAETTKLASISPNGDPANQGAIPTGMSFDGSSVILESESTNLGAIAAGTKQVFRVPASYWEAGCLPSSNGETTCDGIDDDCDGEIDEDFAPYEVEATCGVGACTAAGMATACNNGTEVITCTPGAPTGLLENFCNGVDDDCNGQVDEDYQFEGQPTTCPRFVSPPPDGIVCTDRLWVRVRFQEPVDPATTSISAILTEGVDTPAPIETDVSDLFTIVSDGAHGYVDLAVLGEWSISINGVTATFERLADGDAACPLCDDLELTQEDLEPLIEEIVQGVSDPWGELNLVLDAAAADLGCVWDAMESFVAKQEDECRDCERKQCDGVDYCGRGNSESRPEKAHPRVGACVNRTCFKHDNCYLNDCVQDQCAFTDQSDSNGCDSDMFAKCDDPTCATTLKEKSICIAVKAYRRRPSNPECRNAACGPDGICCQHIPLGKPSCGQSCEYGGGCPRCQRTCYITYGCPADDGECPEITTDRGDNPGICVDGEYCEPE